MDEKKIEYLKRRLEQALQEDDYNGVNSCYQELLKYVEAADMPQLAQKVNAYNSTHFKKPAPGTVSEQTLKGRVRAAKKKFNLSSKCRGYGIGGGLAGMVLGCILVMSGAGAFGDWYNDFVMYGGLVISILGFVGIITGTVFACIYSSAFVELQKCRKEVFKFICAGEDKLKYLENVDGEADDAYIGQMDGIDAHGFGVGLCDNGSVYVGQWKDNVMSGIGKLISDDMRMVLEGEFYDGRPDGIVDIQWEDGGQWHGTYKRGMPWNGEGKTIVENRILEGTWKNGVKIL